MYKLLGGYPNHLNFFLHLDSVYNTNGSQTDGVYLEIPYFDSPVYNSTKHFGLSFAYDAP